MTDFAQILTERIALGEDSSLELKEVRVLDGKVAAPARASLADELAALANARGGVVVLGVRDAPRDVVGIPLGDLDAVESFVANLLHDTITPPLIAHVDRVWLADSEGTRRAVVCVQVPRSLFVHQSPGGYLLRIGSSKRKMAPDLLARLFQQRSQSRLLRFDETPVVVASLADLDPDAWRPLTTVQTQGDEATVLGKLGMAARDDDGVWRPTVAGLLVAGTEPQAQLRAADVQAVAYRGTTPAPAGDTTLYQLDAQDIGGTLAVQIIEACRFVNRNMKVGATKSLGRRDIPQYDLVAVFEAMVNAVAHRDYSLHGARVRLRMFADRLEICSPGALANTLDVASLPFRQAARNEAIASLLAKAKVPQLEWLATPRATFMDRRGEGVPVILDRSEALSGKLPLYREIDTAELQLTIWAAPAGLEVDERSGA